MKQRSTQKEINANNLVCFVLFCFGKLDSDLSLDGISKFIPRTRRHHNLKLLEINGAIAVTVDAPYHSPALSEGTVVPQAPQHLVQFLGGNGSVPVNVVHRKRIFQILHHLRGINALGVQLHELVEVDESVPVRVYLLHHLLQLLLRGSVSQAGQDGPQLRRRDLAVSVRIEFVENLSEFMHVGDDHIIIIITTAVAPVAVASSGGCRYQRMRRMLRSIR